MTRPLRRVDLEPEARELAWANARARSVAPIGDGSYDPEAYARRSLEADPTSILDGDEELRLAVARHVTPAFGPRPWVALPDMRAAVEALREALEAAAASMVEAFNLLRDAMRGAGAAWADFAGRLEEVQRSDAARHGSAAACPRHGPTRGGTCRKCRGRRWRGWRR